ncbi:cell adhesion molecule 3-like [Mercenaria mercenaria]|uniref:cell adhesion molecule 3-like n=1 Tax=Mercenaria mercenaria TaxID=6596 RepID=UPI00234F142D|nr:cell adhesion molecule 3-like [Mercenaria mercenaria]
MYNSMLDILGIILSLVIQLSVFCSAQQLVVTTGDNVTIPCTSVVAYPVWVGPEMHNGNVMNYNNPGNKTFANPYLPVQKKVRLEWGSDDKSLVIKNVTMTDEGLYQCSDRTNLFVRVPPRTPIISNAEQSTENSLIIRATESQVTSLICVSSGGYPEPLVEWYRGNTGTKPLISTSTVTAGTRSYNVSEKYTFTPERQDDGTRYICQSSFKTDPRHISAVSVELVLNLKPNLPTAWQTSAVSAGNIAEVKCSINGSRPAANMSWSYQEEIPAGEVTSTLDTSSETYTVISLFKRRVSAEDNGQTVQCVVTHIALIEPPQLTASVALNVHYPPVVTVTATNTTVKAKHAVLICNATGSPNTNYKYGKWVHTWPGINTVLSEKPGSERLVLTNLTYEHSGVYTCSASNRIKVFGTTKEFIEGSVKLLVKSFPVITNPTVNSVNASAAVNGWNSQSDG